MHTATTHLYQDEKGWQWIAITMDVPREDCPADVLKQNNGMALRVAWMVIGPNGGRVGQGYRNGPGCSNTALAAARTCIRKRRWKLKHLPEHGKLTEITDGGQALN